MRIDGFKSVLNSDTLLGRCVRGGGILAAGSALDSLFRFLRNLILARILLPDAFGLMAAVVASVAAIEAFTEVGFKQSLIQNKKGDNEDFLNVIWWFSSLRGLLIYLIAISVTPLICDFYHRPDAVLSLRVGFLVILFNSMVSPRLHVLEKEMRFKRWVVLVQSAGLLGTLVGIVSAFYLRNVWALILAYITESFLRFLMSFVFYPIKPRFRIQREYAREIRSFSKSIYGLPVLMMLFAQTDVFVIGKVLSFEKLGLYYLAKDLADFPNKILSKIISPLVLPTFSLMQDEREKLKHALLSINKAIALFLIPFVVFSAMFSESILILVYGQNYGQVAVPFILLSLSVFIYICTTIIMSFYLAIAKPDIHRFASLVRTTLLLVLIYPAIKLFGLIGVSFTILLAMFSCLIIQVYNARKHIGLEFGEYFGTWSFGALLSFIIIVIPGGILKVFAGPSALLATGIGAVLCLCSWSIGLFAAMSLGNLSFLNGMVKVSFQKPQ